MNLYIYSYNNYYNRLVKKAGDNIDDYAEWLHYGPVQGVYGFTPGDGMNTEQLLGTNDNLYDGKGDYLIAHNPQTDKIDSRWFIIENTRTRNGQWKLVLHRDIVVDMYNEVLTAPMYIEKATIADSDVAIWNSEGVAVNQIKTNEFTIQDDSKCAWIVGYLDRKFDGFKDSNNTTTSISIQVTDPPFYDEMTEEEFEEDILSLNNYQTTLNYQFAFEHEYISNIIGGNYKTVKQYSLSSKNYDWFEWQDPSLSPFSSLTANTSSYTNKGNLYTDVLSKLSTEVNKKIIDAAKLYVPFIIEGSKEKFDSALKLNGKIYKVNNTQQNTHKYYQLVVTDKQTTPMISYTVTTDLTMIDGVSAVPTYLTNLVSEKIPITGTIKGRIYPNDHYISLRAVEILTSAFDFRMSEQNQRAHLVDAPYDMFCIPYKEGGLRLNLPNLNVGVDEGLEDVRTLDTLSTLAFAQDLARQLDQSLKDIQLLPYCPLKGWEMDGDVFTSYEAKNNKDCNYTKITDDFVAIIFYSSSSQGTINSEQLHIVNTENGQEVNISELPMIQNKKLSNECDMYRLCSPNYNGQFEFNPSKMEGITGFNVDYTYLPFSPYIKLNPNFGGLYGRDFDDARGVTCQGDFSISYLSDAWENYQTQNKNYLNTFNRQIENMEVTQDVQRKQQIFNAVTGTITGGAAGALMGSKGGAPGMIAGALVGTAASAVGGALDVYYGDVLRNEALDYTKDMFNYQIDNIKALPNSIARVTAYTKNNKIFPILEYYTCSETEKRAIANKIAYNGMTVMRIGTIQEFKDNAWSYNDIKAKGYIKGKLIRLEFEVDHEGNKHSDNFHVLNSLSGELNKGIFIEVEGE